MSKFSTRPARANVHAPIQSEARPSGRTYEGGDGYARDAKGELFLLAVTNMVAEKSFYESADDRDERFEELVHQVTKEDPSWMRKFVPWLRDEANMRTASLVAAAEYVKAGGEHGRQLVDAVCKRADEPGEMLAYWHQRYGRKLPMAVKRGVADAAQRLYNERSVLKWDGQAKAWRFADVIELVHPKPQGTQQAALFKYLLDMRHDHPVVLISEQLPTILADSELREASEADRRAMLGGRLWIKANWSWERLSGWLPGGMDKEAWEAVIPQMGYMALLRNLRNFDEAGVGGEAYQRVVAKLTDPDEVKRSRQFPSRFLSAYKAVSSERWKYPLEQALELSLNNVPALTGKSLILVDVSGSMVDPLSAKSDLRRWEAAAVFAAALAKRADHADLYAYSSDAEGYAYYGGPYIKTQRKSRIVVPRGGSVFSIVKAVQESPSFGGGTETWQVAKETFASHDRVIILTDEQVAGGYSQTQTDPGPKEIPLVHTFNLAGYKYGQGRTGDRGRYTFGGFSDHGLRAIPMLEAQRDGVWPWESNLD